MFFPSFKRLAAVLAALLLFNAVSAQGEEQSWYKSMFISASPQYYFVPDPLSDFLKTEIGFRAGLGYELWRLRFSLESGYSRLEGTNPLVHNISVIPLLFKTSYFQPIYKGFALEAVLSIGSFFSTVNHHETAIDLIFERESESKGDSFAAGLRLYADYTFKGGFLTLYAGGGLDAVFETDGPIPLPVIEAGVLFKPFALFRPRPKAQLPAQIEEISEIEESVASEDEEYIIDATIIYYYREKLKRAAGMTFQAFPAEEAAPAVMPAPLDEEISGSYRKEHSVEVTITHYLEGRRYEQEKKKQH